MFSEQDEHASDDGGSVDSTTSMDFSNDDSFGIAGGSGSARRIDRNGVVLGVILLAAVVSDGRRAARADWRDPLAL